LFWAVPSANGEIVGGREIVKEPANAASYCHMQFPPMREDSLSWDRPVFDENAGNSIDFYGPCDHDPLGADEVKAQRRVHIRDNYEDSE
jgi:hypothetical protein